MTENNINIVDKIVIIHPVINTWGGRKKLDPSDLGDIKPPKDLVSLGNKRIVPKDVLRPFEAFKKRLDRTMMKFGIRLIGGYAVAEENFGVLAEKLQEFEAEFNQMKDDFIRNFDQHVEAQVSAYPEWAGSLRAAAAEVEPHLSEKFGCGYKAYKLIPPESEEDGNNAGNRFVKDEEVTSQAVSEISTMADKALVRLSGKEELKQTFLKTVRNIREKLLNLASLDRNFFGGAVRVIDNVLGQMPTKGPIQGRDRKTLTSLLFLLRSLTEETQKNELLAGDYDNPEELIKAMGYEPDESKKTRGFEEDEASAQTPENNAAQIKREALEEMGWF